MPKPRCPVRSRRIPPIGIRHLTLIGHWDLVIGHSKALGVCWKSIGQVAISAAVLLLATWHSASFAGLIEHVKVQDPSFEWKHVEKRVLSDEVTAHELSLVSQTWRGIAWRHRLTVAVPQDSDPPAVALILIGGSGRGPAGLAADIAKETGCIVALLNDVPVQPLFGGLREDALIAYTFEKYLQTEDETWPLLLPMTKSAVAAMDAIQEFCRQDLDLDVSGFVVAGASKRGWTTWLCATDSRVKGIVPMVYDNLNLPNQMRHQRRVWGRFSEMIGHYTEKGLPQVAAEGGGAELVKLVDPHCYLDRITIPKLIVIGTNDRYWPVDALNVYYGDLVGETYILYVPNAGHGLDGDPRVPSDLNAFLLMAAGRLKFPQLAWRSTEDKDAFGLSLSSDVMPKRVLAWVAESDSRDFRDAVWRSVELAPAKSEYRHALPLPAKGYAAIFGEAVYDLDGRELFLSTNVYVVGARSETARVPRDPLDSM